MKEPLPGPEAPSPGITAAQVIGQTVLAKNGVVYRGDQPASTFDYVTDKPHEKNWIGIYRASGGGPDREQHVQDSLAWAYAPNQRGSVRLPTESLLPGEYKAYFLAQDGYKWLANPTLMTLSGAGASLSLVTNDPPFEFKYSTPAPKPKNWIGIYKASGGGPENEKYVSNSLAWGYAPEGQGTVRVSAPNLAAGEYKAFFLQDDGYKWAANPIVVKHPGTPFHFIVSDYRTLNVWQGQELKASVGGLLANAPDGKTKFVKAGSSHDVDWVKVSPDGTLSGTPDTSPGTKKLIVEAIASNGARAKLRVLIPVINSGSPLVEKMSVMTYNLWFDGTRVNDYHNKQVRFISNSGADIVGLQESGAGSGARLAKALGWEHWQGSVVSIISRYPILEVYQPASKGGAVRVALGKKQIVMWNLHLGYDPYGPYDFCFDHMTREQVFEREKQSGRTPQIIEIMQRMKDAIGNADKVPVVLTGDFNAPSHLDWNDRTKHLHCDVGDVAWPTSKYPTDAGLIDSYRVVRNDPVAKPGITWSPIFLNNNGRPEPMDRIDFIYHKGLKVLESETQVVGNPSPEPYERNNEWTSDHAAVKTIFNVPA